MGSKQLSKSSLRDRQPTNFQQTPLFMTKPAQVQSKTQPK